MTTSLTTAPTFGRLVTAMVTPMHPDGSLDLDGAAAVARHLVEHGHSGIVVNGTTGESATVDDDEKFEVLAAVVDAVGDDAFITFGVGTNDTRHSVRLAERAASAGAHGLLLVTPYYNNPTQAGIVAHSRTVATSTPLPVLLYDIPHRTGRPFAPETLAELAEVDQVKGVKDATSNLWSATRVMAETGLEWYSGVDELNLPYLSIGACGLVSVVGHVAGARYAQLLDAVAAGDLDGARRIHRELVPLVDVLMNTSQGAIMAKAALVELGVIRSAAVRSPYLESTPEQLDALRAALAATTLS